MNFSGKSFLLSILGLLFFTGCFNHTLPTVKRLDKGEKIWGASFGIPIFSSQSSIEEDPQTPNPAKEFSWSLWYGYGASSDLDYYLYVGELGGAGILFNNEIKESSVSSVVLNYGIGTVNGIYGFRPRIGINYSDGKDDVKKQVGFLTGVSYDFSGNEPELVGDYELYAGLDQKKDNHFYFGRLGLQKVNKFSHKFSEISKWGPQFLSYREWAKTPYHLNIESGIGSIKK
ncbi:MAG: hypothetical protein PHX78_02570 [bacterium]|nr:hypothetical protein [bacterium]